MPLTKIRISVYIDETLWRDFRLACLQRQHSASQHLSVLMAGQLEEWKEKSTQEQPTDPKRDRQ